jgi:ring-1,2-phenylacetyl-CoA epoxidase subunit PaaE
MIETTENALLEAGVPGDRVHTERFTTGTAVAARVKTDAPAGTSEIGSDKDITMTLILDGKEHEVLIGPDDHLLDAALEAGLDLPFSCKAGVCCTCRAKVLEGQTAMDKNFTLEADEMAQGFVLSCQARALGKTVCISFDER